MTIGKRKGATAKGVGDDFAGTERFGGSLSKNDHWYLHQAFGMGMDPGAAPPGLDATGGVISEYVDPGPGNVYKSHTFSESGIFEIDSPTVTSVDVLVVAGGGAGGSSGPGAYETGGGGAGGFRTKTSIPVSAAAYPITVGAGGAGILSDAFNGNDSIFNQPGVEGTTKITSTGGGQGGGGSPGAGDPGGSGGGARRNSSFGVGNTPPYSPVQGYDGGDDYSSGGSSAGGGGGGASAVGTDGTSGVAGDGGNGLANDYAYGPTGPVTYAGGGGGGTFNTGLGPPSNGAGGTGGGGAGGPGVPSPTVKCGGMGLGGGGGGAMAGDYTIPAGAGGNGGSGVVVVRYQIASATQSAKATGGAISFYSGKTIHAFIASGTFATGPTWTPATVEYVVVAGGGGGNINDVGAGGGAGGYLTGTTPIGAHPVSTTIQVGGGGIRGRATNERAGDGTPSYFGTPITSAGGGGGSAGPGNPGTTGIAGENGGSGGGSSYQGPTTRPNGNTPPAPAPIGGPQGYDGGLGASPGAASGGGGGAGGQGGDASANVAGHGGIGVQIPATYQQAGNNLGVPGPGGTEHWVGGGGGGTTDSSPLPVGGGGGAGGPYAGGGQGGHYPAGPYGEGSSGTINTGGGGGATDDGDDAGTTYFGGNGGSGLVLVAYPT